MKGTIAAALPHSIGFNRAFALFDLILKTMEIQKLPRHSKHLVSGLSLIQLMNVVAIVGILAAFALPRYQSYILKNRATSATADLTGLRAMLENRIQKTSSYPLYSTPTLIDASPSARPETVAREFATWVPSQGKWFTYSIISSANSYTVFATGMGNMNCTLSLDNKNARTASGSACGFTAW